MPESVISSLFTRSSSKNSVSKEYKCTVQLLDDSESITVEFKKNESGQSVIDYVCDYLQIVEKDYFGLRFLDSSKHRYWLDPTKPVLKQVKTEQGDYDPEINKEGYVSEFKLFLKQTAKVEEKVEDIHKSLSGQTPAQAEENFVRKAAKLDTYGFDPYNVKDTKAGQVYLGATHLGIIVYQSNKKLHHITWDELEKVDYLGKDFYVYPKPEYIMDGASANQTLPQLNGTKEEENEIDASILGSRNSSKANLSLDSHEDEAPVREEPSFVRYHADRQPSRLERSFPWGSFHSKSDKEKPESNGAVTGELQKEGKTLLLDATDGVSPLHSPAELSPDSIIASSDLDTSLYRGETGSPLSNSTPLKIQPVKISDTNELKSRYAPMGDKLDKTTISVSLSSKESTNQAGSTGDAVAKGENDTSATGGGGEKRGVCCRLIGHLLTGLLLGIILITIVVAVFEVKDSQFRGYVHAIPGLEHFRHTFYEPGRGYVMDQYGYVLGKNKRFWFAP